MRTQSGFAIQDPYRIGISIALAVKIPIASGSLSGLSIAFTIRSVDRSLFSHLIYSFI